MKKILLFLFVFIAISACKKKEEEPAATVGSPFSSTAVTCNGTSCINQ